MTDMAELKKRKEPLNLAIVHVDPDAFIANLMGWLEITAFIKAQRLGGATAPADGKTPALSPDQMRKSEVHDVGNDAIFAFGMTAAMKADKAAVDRVEAALVESMGKMLWVAARKLHPSSLMRTDGAPQCKRRTT
jgi:hypothetical protein